MVYVKEAKYVFGILGVGIIIVVVVTTVTVENETWVNPKPLPFYNHLVKLKQTNKASEAIHDNQTPIKRPVNSLHNNQTSEMFFKKTTTKNYSVLRDERYEMMEERYSDRRRLLQDRCRDSPPKSRLKVEGGLPVLSYYNAKYGIFVCVTAKAGTSTWKNHLMKMRGTNFQGRNMHGDWANNRLRATEVLRKTERAGIKNSPSISRIISVRHPISRLISAYADKFADGRTHKPKTVRIKYVKKVAKLKDVSVYRGKKATITFNQFLQLILHEKKNLVTMNNHWVPQYVTCGPCSYPYDYIMKLETISEDLDYFIQKLKMKEVNVNFRSNPSKKKSDDYEDYFKDVPIPIIKEIFELYRPDFYLFGYDVPEFFHKLNITE